jgi:hypothetical protein
MLESILLTNIGPFYGTHKVVFPTGIIHVRGVYSDDPTRSNRSGKSMFLQAIYHTLYGGNIANLLSEGETVASTELSIDGNTYSRSIKEAKYNDEVVTQTILSNKIESSITGLSQLAFDITANMTTSNLYGFLKLPVKEQKSFLLEIVNDPFDWDAVFTTLKSNLSVINERLSRITAKIDLLEEQKSNVKDISFLWKELKKLCASKREVQYELSNLTHDNIDLLAKSLQLKAAIHKLNTDIKTAIKQEVHNEALKAERDSYKNKMCEIEAKLQNYESNTSYSNKHKKLQEEYSTLLEYTRNLASRINVYTKSNSLCPILKESCLYQDKLDSVVQEWIAQVHEKTPILKALESDLKQLEEKMSIVSTLSSELHTVTQKYYSILSQCDKVQDLVELRGELKHLSTEYELLDYEVIEQQQRNCSLKLHSLVSKIGVIRQTIRSWISVVKQLKELNSEYTELQKQQAEYVVATELTSPHGIPYLHLLAIFSKLEVYINYFLDKVGMKVHLLPYKELASLEDVCELDNYMFHKAETICPKCGTMRRHKIKEQLTLITADRGISWEHESSGGKALIAIGVRFGLLKLLKEAGANCSFIFMDEIFGNLDEVNKLSVLQLIEFAIEDLHLQQVFIISHDELNKLLPTTITVVREVDKSIIKEGP